jgi:hypothetical protein
MIDEDSVVFLPLRLHPKSPLHGISYTMCLYEIFVASSELLLEEQCCIQAVGYSENLKLSCPQAL